MTSVDFRQQVDVAGKGVEVVKMMSIWETLLEHSVGDQGIKFVDSSNKSWAAFPVDMKSSANSFVKEVEILRGDMATEHDNVVTVSFNKGRDRDFDIVVCADGIYSSTRNLAFGKSSAEIRSLKQCTAIMSIPWQESDGEWSKWYNAPGGRCVVLRPQPKLRKTGAYLALMTPESGRFARMSVNDQKQEFTKKFHDAGWEAPRILQQLATSDDVYFQETAQIHCLAWVKGRVALLGDAGYCPSGVSGQGTTLAYVGAYILAGCICTCEDPVEALKQYEDQVRPFVEKAQQLIPGVPGIANPQTSWGITVFYTVLWLGSLLNKAGLPGWLSWLSAPFTTMATKELKLSEYSAMSGA